MDGVETWSRTLTTEQCLAALSANGVPCSAYRTVAEALADPQIAHRGALAEVEDGGGTLQGHELAVPDVAANVSAGKRAATLGEHTVAFLSESGLSEDEIAGFTGKPAGRASVAAHSAGIGYAWCRRRREMRGNVCPGRARQCPAQAQRPITGKSRRERNDEEFQGHRFQCAPCRRWMSRPRSRRDAGADQGQGGRRLPQRPAHLGRRLRSRPWPQAAVAERSRRVAAADHGARDRRRNAGVRARRQGATPAVSRSATSRWSIPGSAAANARPVSPATRICASSSRMRSASIATAAMPTT